MFLYFFSFFYKILDNLALFCTNVDNYTLNFSIFNKNPEIKKPLIKDFLMQAFYYLNGKHPTMVVSHLSGTYIIQSRF